MKKYAISLAFTSLVLLRVITGQPDKLTEGTKVRLVIPTIDYPEYTDSQTIIKRGDWEVRVKGYTPFIPGDVVGVEGLVDRYGRVESGELSVIESERVTGIDYLLIKIALLRHWAIGRLKRILPEPHASLASGILLGVKQQMPRDFYEQLVNTGTMHVVAASGYNVSIIGVVLMSCLGMIMGKKGAIIGSVVGIVGYVILAGGGASIVRAGVMGGLALIGVGLGRKTEARRLLWVAVVLMLVVKPALFYDVGFQLSVSATIGLMYLGEYLSGFSKYIPNGMVREVVETYLIPTLAATVATLPVIGFHFGRIALIGVFVNVLILPVVPLIMLLSALSVVFTPVGYLLYVPLAWVVAVIRWFG